jgi:hypothetical protein
MEYQDNKPSDNPTDRADEHGKQVDGYLVSKNEVSEEKEDHSDDAIDDELPQITSASRQHEQDHYHHQYEYDEFHQAPLYMRSSSVLRVAANDKAGAFLYLPLFTQVPREAFPIRVLGLSDTLPHKCKTS